MDPTPLPPPLPVLSADEKIWVILSHLSLLIGVGFILPLVVYLVKKADSPVVGEHAREVLNFHLSVYIYAFVGFLLSFVLIGIPMLMVLGFAAVVLSIVGAVKAADGLFYRYPLTIRLI